MRCRSDATAWVTLIALGILCTACSGSSAECTTDADCATGRYCQAGNCSFDCTYDTECPDGFRCSERGECVRGCARTNGGIEACDGVDNDCDDSTDEDFPDLNQPCQFPPCPPGTWLCSADGSGLECDGRQPAADDFTCDGIDDDCDDSTDEDVTAQPCELQAGVCTGSTRICGPGGIWQDCDYGAEHTPGTDAICDQLDNDCDGETDEDTLAVLVAEQGAQANDGLDNNCNGLTDEPGGVMVNIADEFAMDAFEVGLFLNADCSGTQYGLTFGDYPPGFPPQGTKTTDLYACSIQSILPSGYLSWYRAGWACQAQGKRLCTAAEYRQACAGTQNLAYPYGMYWVVSLCNEGWAAPSQVAETGTYDQCVSDYSAYDMSGNLWEWVADDSQFGPNSALVGGGSYACIWCYDGLGCIGCSRTASDEFEFDKINNCFPDSGRDYEAFQKHLSYAYLGTRCCLNLP